MTVSCLPVNFVSLETKIPKRDHLDSIPEMLIPEAIDNDSVIPNTGIENFVN